MTKKTVTTYKIHNMSRAIETRPLRAAATAHRAPKKLLLGGGVVRVLRGRPATVTESTLRRMLPELQKREARGELKVTNMFDQRVDLTTLKPMESVPAAALKPRPPQDTAATDNKYPVGESKPQYLGGAAASEKLETPSVITPDIPEGKEEGDFELATQEVYDSYTKSQLIDLALDFGVGDTGGNKMDLVRRLVEAGLRSKDNEE